MANGAFQGLERSTRGLPGLAVQLAGLKQRGETARSSQALRERELASRERISGGVKTRDAERLFETKRSAGVSEDLAERKFQAEQAETPAYQQPYGKGNVLQVQGRIEGGLKSRYGEKEGAKLSKHYDGVLRYFDQIGKIPGITRGNAYDMAKKPGNWSHVQTELLKAHEGIYKDRLKENEGNPLWIQSEEAVNLQNSITAIQNDKNGEILDSLFSGTVVSRKTEDDRLQSERQHAIALKKAGSVPKLYPTTEGYQTAAGSIGKQAAGKSPTTAMGAFLKRKPNATPDEISTFAQSLKAPIEKETLAQKDLKALGKRYSAMLKSAQDAEMGVDQFIPEESRMITAKARRESAGVILQQFIAGGGDPKKLGVGSMPAPPPKASAASVPASKPASKHKGRIIRDTDTGKRYKSNGKAWIEIK